MIEYDALNGIARAYAPYTHSISVSSSDAVASVSWKISIAGTRCDVLNKNIVGLNNYRPIAYLNARVWSSLTKNGDVGVFNRHSGQQIDVPGYLKYACAGSASDKARSKGTRARVIEIGYLVHGCLGG